MRSPLAFRPWVRSGAALLAALAAAACVAQGAGLLQQDNEDDPGAGAAPGFFRDASRPEDEFDLPDVEPHAVRGIEPGHGSFAGGQRAVVRGAGFSDSVRVWLGVNEVPAADVTPIDPHRVQVLVPRAAPGTVDVAVQNGEDASTRRVLERAYTYDAFYVSPSSGPTSGGTVITLVSQGTSWDTSAKVTVDLESCEVLAIRGVPGGDQELDCRTPAGTAGAKPVSVAQGDDTVSVRDAFVYGNSEDGFRGGFRGDPLGDRLQVLALSSATGTPIPGASVILGDSERGAESGRAGPDGFFLVERDGLGPRQTVTVAAECFQPVTFVDVPVDSVTAYLDRVLSPACTPEGDPVLIGGARGTSSSISGEIVFPGGREFQRAPWFGVPHTQTGGSRRAAYVFALSRDPRRAFELPNATAAITPDSDGEVGYGFRIQSGLGNLSLYVLAGVENRDLTPPLFTAYTMGLVTGVLGEPNKNTGDVFVPMTIPLDHALTVEVRGPAPQERGPNRLKGYVAVRVGTLGHVILPIGQRDALLSSTNTLSFVGLPAFVEGLSQARYVVSASADTGLAGTPPLSVIGTVSPPPGTRSVHLSDFLEVPRFDYPSTNGHWSGLEVAVSAAAGGPAADLTLVELHSPAASTRWKIVAPGDTRRLILPDPAAFPELGIAEGPVALDVTRARLLGFDYASFGYTDLLQRNWEAYAKDTLQAQYE